MDKLSGEDLCTLADPVGVAANTLGKSVIGAISSTGDPVVIHEELSFDQQQLLVSNFPELSLKFSSSVKHPHPYAAASRKCELNVLLKRVGALRTPGILSTHDDFVCDVGGDFSAHVLGGRPWVHSCCPLLDIRDRQRKVSRLERLFRYVSSSSNVVNNAVDCDVFGYCKNFVVNDCDKSICDKFVCDNKAQDCMRTARYGLSLHSCYDISLHDFADIMVHKDMSELYGTFIYSDVMYVEREGTIPGVECHYTIDESNDRITFSFENDLSTVYVHSLKNYFSLLTINYFYDKTFTYIFFVELLENRAGVQFFKITKSKAVSMEHNAVTRYIWLPSLKGKTKVNFFELDYSRLAVGDFKRAFVPISFYVDTAIVDKCVSHCYSSTEAKFKPVEVFQFLTAYNGRIFFGSDVCIRHKQIPSYKAMLLANAIYLHVFVKKYDIGKVNQMLMAAVRHDRSLCDSSLFSKLFHRKFTPPNVLDTGHHGVFRWVRSVLAPLHAFLFWFKRSPFFAKKFLDESVRFIRCDTDLTPLEYLVFDKGDQVVDRRDVVLPEALMDSTSFDVKRVMGQVLGEFVCKGERVLSAAVLDQVVLKTGRVKPVMAPSSGFSKRLFGKVLDGSSRVFECFSKFQAMGFDTAIENVSLSVLDVVDPAGLIVVSRRNVALVNKLLGKGFHVTLVGFETDCYCLLNAEKRDSLRVVEGSGDLCVTVINAMSSLKFDYVVVDDDLNDLEDVYCTVLNSKFSVRTLLCLSNKLSFQVFFYMLSFVEVRFSVDFVKNFYLCNSKCSFDLLRVNISKFCDFMLMNLNADVLDVDSSLECGGFSESSSSDSTSTDVTVVPVRTVLGESSSQADVLSSVCVPEVPDVTNVVSSVCVSNVSAVDGCVSNSCESRAVVVLDSPVVDVLDELVVKDVESVEESVDLGDLVVCAVESSQTELNSDVLDIFSDVDVVPVVKGFVDKLDFERAVKRPGRRGVRYEWLFGPSEYVYGGGTTRPLGSRVPEELCKLPFVSDFNTLLVVYYPEGTSGLTFHKDDEEVMDGMRVLTYSSGAECDLLVKNVRTSVVQKFRLDDSKYYLLKDQTESLHAVNVCGPRFALTFRNFKVVESNDVSVGVTAVPVVVPNLGRGECLFLSLTGSTFSDACWLRNFIHKNRPVVSPNSLYVVSEVDEECAKEGVYAGISSIIAFCDIFYSNVEVVDSTGQSLFVYRNFSQPFYNIRLRYSEAHYERVSSSCSVSVDSQSVPFVLSPINLDYVLEVINKTFKNSSCDGVLSYLMRFLRGDTRFVPFDPVHTSAHVFYNLLSECCFSSECVCADGCVRILCHCLDKGVREMMVLVPLTYRKIHVLESFLNSRGLAFSLMVLPGLVKRGFCLLYVDFSERLSDKILLSSSFNIVQRHSNTCVDCDSNFIVNDPYFNHVTRTYYFCASAGQSRVQFVDDFKSVAKVFKLRIVPRNSTPEDKLVVECDNVVIVPVRVKSVGVLSTNSANVNSLKRALKQYFVQHGCFSCVGIINCGIHDLSLVVDIFSMYCSKVLIRKSPVEVEECGVDFRPEYVPSAGDASYICNALIESREYYRATVSSIVNNMKPLHEQYIKLFSDRSTRELVSETTNNRPDFGLIDMDKGVFVIQPKEEYGPYSFAFDGKTLCDISSAFRSDINIDNSHNLKKISDWLIPGKFKGYFSVSKDTKLVNGDKIYRKLKNVDLTTVDFDSKITLVEGVPGCGKTQYIISNHEFSLKDYNHIVLTSSREAANDLRRRVAREHGCSSNHPMLRKKYRTVDSFLMHFRVGDFRIDTVWCDEGLMKPFGDVLWCAVLSRCKNLIIIGDRAQIPFVNRVGGIVLHYSQIKLSPSTMNYEFLGVTYRCPVDVAVLLNRFGVYTKNVVSRSNVRYSVVAKHIENPSEVLGSEYKDYQVLTFTQGEKHDIAKMSGRKVMTINEFQGNQAENVLLIRTQPKELTVFSSDNHILVGISRHTKRFVYATVVQDRCFSICSESVSLRELEKASAGGFSGGSSRDISSFGGKVTLRGGSINGVVCVYDVNRSRLLGGGVCMGKTDTKQYPLARVVPRVATMVDMLKQNVRIRDFVQNNLGVGVVPMRVHQEPIEIVLPDLPVGKPYYVSDCKVTMQAFYDEIFPGHSVVDTSYDGEIFAQDDLYFSTKEMLRLTTFETFQRSHFDGLNPALRTSCPTPIVSGLKQVLKAFYDRNGNVPSLQGQVDEYAIVDHMFSLFVDAFIGDVELFKTFSGEPVTVNVDSIEDWLYTQPPVVSDLAFDQQFWSIFNRELNTYSLILKKLPKPRLDIGAMGKYPSPQTIAHLTKDVNAVFCPIFREVKRRLVSVLRENVVFFSDMSVFDLEQVLSVRLPTSRLSKLKYLLEVDMSKYDKSQGRVALLFEIKLLRALGFPEELISTWSYMHVYSRIVDRINKVVAKVLFQRKSGDAWTFGGNTVHLMAVLLYVLYQADPGILEDFREGNIFVLFSGDDSILFSPYEIDTMSLTSELANCFNLESKLLNFKTPYFCSKFLIFTPWGRWVVVPDVVKMLIKLGRHDLLNYDHAEEYRISCLDVAAHLGNSVLYPLFDACLIDRYKLDLNSLGPLYSAMFTCFSSKEKFASLYFVKETSRISTKVFRKIFDM